MRIRGIAFAVLAGAAALAAPGVALSAQPDCGDLITKDVKLKEDLDCSGLPSDSLAIADDDVTIDLGGNTLIGNSGANNAAIDNGGGFDHLTVTNGRIDGASTGIDSVSGSHGVYSRLAIQGPGGNTGIGISQASGLSPKLTRVSVEDIQTGWLGSDNFGIKIKRLTVTGNAALGSIGLSEDSSTGTIDRLKANGAFYGALLKGETSGLTIKDSTTNNAGEIGIRVVNATPLFKYRYTLKDNVARDADKYGFNANFDVLGGGNVATGAGVQNCRNVPCK